MGQSHHTDPRLPAGRRRERCLLGILLLQPNVAVSTERLVDLLWEENAPDTARAGVHTHIARLRAVLDPDGTGGYGLRLQRKPGGYLAEVDASATDAYRFRKLVNEAMALPAPGDQTPACLSASAPKPLRVWSFPHPNNRCLGT